jgi:hypothetical protein
MEVAAAGLHQWHYNGTGNQSCRHQAVGAKLIVLPCYQRRYNVSVNMMPLLVFGVHQLLSKTMQECLFAVRSTCSHPPFDNAWINKHNDDFGSGIVTGQAQAAQLSRPANSCRNGCHWLFVADTSLSSLAKMGVTDSVLLLTENIIPHAVVQASG